jgi:hypothetical protein
MDGLMPQHHKEKKEAVTETPSKVDRAVIATVVAFYGDIMMPHALGDHSK